MVPEVVSAAATSSVEDGETKRLISTAILHEMSEEIRTTRRMEDEGFSVRDGESKEENPTVNLTESSVETPRSSEGEGLQDVDVSPLDSAVPDVLSDELRDRIVRQVEYYFSDENLPTDKFMLKHVQRDKEGFLSIALITSFRRMKRLVQDLSLVEAALRTSSQLVVSSDGKRVKRLNPLAIPDASDANPRTVLVENLPRDCTPESLQRIFGKVGTIKYFSINDPNSMEEPTTLSKTKIAISSKLHALIEYETAKAAQNAVAILNDEKNWRTGTRVELLMQRMGRYGLIQKTQREASASERKNAGQNDDSIGKEEQPPPSEKAAWKGQYRSRGRGAVKPTSTGHGSVPPLPPSSSSTEGAIKSPPGPRMPDGTRGFSMGRGKPIAATAAIPTTPALATDHKQQDG